MDVLIRSSATRRLTGLIAILGCALGFSLVLNVAQAAATGPWKVCGVSQPPGYQAGGGFCNRGARWPDVNRIEAWADAGSYGVYRATAGYLGAPSASGREYYISSAGYFTQDFHCNPGYAASHNRHSYSVYVWLVDGYTCSV